MFRQRPIEDPNRTDERGPVSPGGLRPGRRWKSCICRHGSRLVPQSETCISPTTTEETAMKKAKKQQYPAGWNETRVRKLAAHYDNQSEDEQAAEIEAALQAEGHTLVVVPTALVPDVIKLISKRRPV